MQSFEGKPHIIFPPNREKLLGNKWNLDEEIHVQNLDVLQLTFLMEQLRESMPVIRDWAYATTDGEKNIDDAEQQRRKMVYTEIVNHYNYFNDLRSRNFRTSSVTFEDLKLNPTFQRRAIRFFELVQGQGLMKELEKRYNGLTLGSESHEQSVEENELLPSEFYDASLYTPDMVSESSAYLEFDLEASLLKKYPDKKYHKELQAVISFLHHIPMSGMFDQEGNLNPDFSLLFIQQKDPYAWQCLQTLLHEADGREILLLFLGKPSSWENTTGKIKSNGVEVNDERQREIFLRMGNPIAIALARSVENISSGENTALRQAEQEVVKQFYGELPEALAFDAEAHILQIEIGKIMEAVEFRDEAEREKFEGMLRLMFSFQKKSWGKNVKCQEVLSIDPDTWAWFIEKLQNTKQEKNKLDENKKAREETVYALKAMLENMWKWMDETVGINKQEDVSRALTSKFLKVKDFFTLGILSVDDQKDKIEERLNLMKKKHERVYAVMYSLLDRLNSLAQEQGEDFKKGMFEGLISPRVEILSNESPPLLSQLNQAYLRRIIQYKEYLQKAKRVSSPEIADALMNFSGWNFEHADFFNMDLDSLVFRNARMDYAKFGPKKNIVNCDFSGAQMRGCVMQRVHIYECNFTNADMRSIIMFGKNTIDPTPLIMQRCLLDRADLFNARLERVEIRSCEGNNVNFSSARLEDTSIERSSFEDLQMKNSNLNNLNIERSHLKNINISHTAIEKAHIKKSDLVEIRGDHAKIKDMILEGVTLQKSSFRSSQWNDSNLRDVTLQQCDLSDAKMTGMTFYGLCMEDTQMKGGSIQSHSYQARWWKDCHLENATFEVSGACTIQAFEGKNTTSEVRFVAGPDHPTWFLPCNIQIRGGMFSGMKLGYPNGFFQPQDISGTSFGNVSLVASQSEIQLAQREGGYQNCTWNNVIFDRR